MNRPRVLVYATVTIILGVSLLSGPAIGLVDLTTPRYDMSGLGEGNATVDRVDAPSSVTLERAYQSESYYLTVPDARIHFSSLSGKPTVAYGIEISELGYSRSTTHFMTEGRTGWVTISLREDTFANDEVTKSGYDGRLTIVLRDSGGKTLVENKSVRIEVEE
mgnify:CR=1 FL=1